MTSPHATEFIWEEPVTNKTLPIIALALTAVIGLAACGSDSKSAETTAAPTTAAVTTAVPTTEAPTTMAPTTQAPTTTEAPTTTAPCAEHESYTQNGQRYECVNGKFVAAAATTTTVPAADGMIWRPTDNTWTADGITSRLEGVVWLDLTRGDKGTFTDECRSQAEFSKDYDHLDTMPTQCIYAVWSFDVGNDLVTDQYSDQGYLTPDALITPDGKQIDSGSTHGAYPGTVNNSMEYVYVDGVPGSVLHFQTGNNKAGWTTQTVQLPGAEGFAPFTH